jgi:hypothetical protein
MSCVADPKRRPLLDDATPSLGLLVEDVGANTSAKAWHDLHVARTPPAYWLPA